MLLPRPEAPCQRKVAPDPADLKFMIDQFWMLAALMLLPLLLRAVTPRIKGAMGERRVAARLRRGLPPEDYLILHDLTLPTARGTTQIDHIVIGPSGVFVIETKTMAGRIFGRADDTWWTQALPRRKSRFLNPLRQNAGHVRAVRDILTLETAHMHGVIVCAGNGRPGVRMPADVLWRPRDLPRYIRSCPAGVIAPDAIPDLAARLAAAALPRTRQTRRMHIRHVRRQMARLR